MSDPAKGRASVWRKVVVGRLDYARNEKVIVAMSRVRAKVALPFGLDEAAHNCTKMIMTIPSFEADMVVNDGVS